MTRIERLGVSAKADMMSGSLMVATLPVDAIPRVSDLLWSERGPHTQEKMDLAVLQPCCYGSCGGEHGGHLFTQISEK